MNIVQNEHDNQIAARIARTNARIAQLEAQALIHQAYEALHPPPLVVDEENDPPAPEDEAVQVHRFFSAINIPRYLDMIGASNKDYCRTKVECVQYIQTAMVDGFLAHREDPSKDELLRRLAPVLERLQLCDLLTIAENRHVVGATIDFVMSQPPDFIYGYISEFINSSYSSYATGLLSCSKGIFERIVTCVLDIANDICLTTAGDCPEIYALLQTIYSPDLVNVERLWEISENNSPEGMERTGIEDKKERARQRRESFINACVSVYRQGFVDMERILSEADKFTYVFEGEGAVAFGVKTKRRKTRKTTRKPRRKPRKTTRKPRRKTTRKPRKPRKPRKITRRIFKEDD
jgi:hypothetical protein